MKLEIRPSRRGTPKAADMLLAERQPSESELFDPRIDLPPGELEHMKSWAGLPQNTTEQARLTVETAWIGWVDPEYRELVQRNTDAKNTALFAFLERWEGKRLRFTMPTDEVEAAEWKLTEKTGAYIDFAELVEAFPEVRAQLKQPEFADDFQELLDRAYEQVLDRHGTGFVHRIQDTKTLVQIWPEQRQTIIKKLVEGGPNEHNQTWFIQQVEGQSSIEHAIATCANLVLLFPELKPKLEEVVKKRMKEVQAHLKLFQEGRKENSVSYRYSMFTKYLTILGAESAFLDPAGNMQVRLRPLPLLHGKKELPARQIG